MSGTPAWTPSLELVGREERHRRLALLGITVVLIASMSSVLGHHISTGLDTLLAGRDHVGALCLIALHELAAPVHHGFHFLFVSGLLYAAWDRASAWLRMRRVLGHLEVAAPSPGGAISAAAARVGVPTELLRVVDGLPSPAFTVGWWAPRIYVARSLGERLSEAELGAVLAHEAAHVARRDPLRLSLLRFLSCTLFWIPALRRLTADLADEAEIRADDAATRSDPLVLASAILNLAHWARPREAADGRVGFDERDDLLERRIRRLAGQDIGPRSHVTRRSLAGAALALGLAWTSGVLMVHPMPAAHHGETLAHCEHPDESAFAHLFCPGFSFVPRPAVCPHAPAA